MRNLYKTIVPVLLVISMVLTMGTVLVPLEGVEENTQDTPMVKETPAPAEKPVLEDKEEPPAPEEPPVTESQQTPKEEPTKEKPTASKNDPAAKEPVKSEDKEDPIKAEEGSEGEPETKIEETEEDTPTARLTINHVERYYEDSDMDSVIMETEIIEVLEVGVTVNSEEYKKDFEPLRFLESDPLELILVEGENELNIYYEFFDTRENEIGESPDFLPGQGVSEALPSIKSFAYGTLGPFPEIERRRMSLFSTMNTESNTVKNGTTATYSDEVNNIEWPEPGSLKIDKVGGSIDGSGNEFEVELKIEGKNRIQTSDIVLVIDRSGSMGDGGRMTNAKAAAKSFVNKLLDDPANTSTRIALVSFSGDVTTYRDHMPFVGSSEKQLLIGAIDALNATGGTHIQAGIKQGIAVLNGSTATNKSIVFLGDGAATYSYKPTNPNNYLENWYSSGGRTYYRTRTDIEGFDYGTRVGSGSNEYQQYQSGGSTWFGTAFINNYRHGAHAVAEARLAPADQNIYTIALGAGTEGDWTLENMANSGYYSTPNPANLEAIYDEIAGSILSAATNAKVIDPLEDMYDILGINASNLTSKITVSHGTLEWDDVAEKITWNIGTISQGTVYTMKYRVALDYSAEGGVFYPANKPTYIEYKNIDDENAKKYFPIPEFRLRELTISKTLIETDAKPGDGNKEFFITLEGPAGPYNKTWSVGLKPGESKTIKGLLPGDYTVKEIVPMNFQATGGSPASISIGEDDWKKSTNITNKRSNGGWFWDDPDPKVNSFTVAGTKRTPALPTREKAQLKLDYFILPAALEEDYKADQA